MAVDKVSVLVKEYSFFFKPQAKVAKCSAAVPLETAKQYLALQKFATLDSSSNNFFPWLNTPDLIELRTLKTSLLSTECFP